MRFHLLGLCHLPVSETYMSCAFTQKIVKMSKMLLSMGHEVYLYGAEGSDAPCTEFIQTHTLKEIASTWGDGDERFEIGYDWKTTGFRHDFNLDRKPVTLRYYAKCIEEINKRKRQDDFLLLTQGLYQKIIAEGAKLALTCEPGVGYRGSYCSYKAFESAYLQNFTYGSQHPFESINGNRYDRVIPNYYDLKDFEFSEKKKDYFLYIGRMIKRKGVWTAIHACERSGKHLILAGQQDDEIDVSTFPSNCEFVGYVDRERRMDLMGHAQAVFAPTTYLEAFGGVNVEAQLCGTPVLASNFGCFPETVEHGKTGFLCNTVKDYMEAMKQVDLLDYDYIRERAVRLYGMENVKLQYQKWFDDLYEAEIIGATL